VLSGTSPRIKVREIKMNIFFKVLSYASYPLWLGLGVLMGSVLAIGGVKPADIVEQIRGAL
jgi:hypothetical protein